MTPEELAAIRERADAADQLIGDLCTKRRQWRMSVPVNLARDSDMVLGAPLMDIAALLAEVERLRSLLDRYACHDYPCPHPNEPCACDPELRTALEPLRGTA